MSDKKRKAAPRREREEAAIENLKRKRAKEREGATKPVEEGSEQSHVVNKSQIKDPDSDDEVEHKEDPLYDPDQDEKDETWVATRRHGRNTDAVLTCPACFAIVCSECQRHSSYLTQFRAVFVENCSVAKGRQVRPIIGDDDPEMKYWAVCCSACNTNIGVMDSDEIYHFHNVLEGR
eukprot:gb/GEZN01009695.1/.p1 GENE.gb/GEZN01009695.1/~~gb/GEZN01009695.1/.p1  ORF type:complete len:177 (+),score=25.65 gb/GEZN01009695.1/:136-666(+)